MNLGIGKLQKYGWEYKYWSTIARVKENVSNLPLFLSVFNNLITAYIFFYTSLFVHFLLDAGGLFIPALLLEIFIFFVTYYTCFSFFNNISI